MQNLYDRCCSDFNTWTEVCQHRQEQRRVLEKWNLLLDLIEVPRSSTRVVSPVLTRFFYQHLCCEGVYGNSSSSDDLSFGFIFSILIV